MRSKIIRILAASGIVWLQMQLFSVNAWAEQRNLIYESPVFTGDREDLIPPDVMEQDGKQYRLVAVELKDAVREAEFTYASASIPYILEGRQEPPDMARITLTDEFSETEYEREVPRLEIFTKETYWSEDFSFPLTVTGYDADTFRIGETEIPVGADMAAYGAAFLKYLELPEDCYEIREVEWIGESYEKEGELCRDAQARGVKLVRKVEAKYGGQVKTPEVRGRQYVGVYEEIREEPKEEAEIVVKETAEVDGEEELPANPQPDSLITKILSWIKESLTVVTVSAGFLLLLLAAVLLFRILQKKKAENEDLQ